MSYTELLLVLMLLRMAVVETSRFGAEPAHHVVGLTNEIKSSGSRIAREEVLCGSAAERFVGWIW